MIANEPSLIESKSATNGLYDILAKKYCTKPRNIETNIRRSCKAYGYSLTATQLLGYLAYKYEKVLEEEAKNNKELQSDNQKEKNNE